MLRPSRLPILLTALTPLAASAHPLGAHTATLFEGLLHPVTGLDHTLAMIAVGLAASRIRERGWIAPASFMASMLAGLVVGALGLVVPFTEWAIVGSVLLFGLIVGRRGELPLTPVALTFGIFALFHGLAHGHEASGIGFDYASGVLLATGALHALGFGLARLVTRSCGKDRVRWAGVPVTIVGLALLISG